MKLKVQPKLNSHLQAFDGDFRLRAQLNGVGHEQTDGEAYGIEHGDTEERFVGAHTISTQDVTQEDEEDEEFGRHEERSHVDGLGERAPLQTSHFLAVK